MDLETFQKHELHLPWEDLHDMEFEVNGRSNSEVREALDTLGDRHYHPCPEGLPKEGVPTGTYRSFTQSLPL